MKVALLVCLFVVMAYQAYLAPYTKVEESFNLQATHDILHQVDRFDHLDFPGVVPRTFFGATLLSAIALPIVDCLPSFFADPLLQQLLIRVLLAGSVVLSLGHFTTSIERVFGKRTAQYMLLLICFTQFHFVFWASRTLPNTMALPFVLMGLSHWVQWIYTESSSCSRTNDTTATSTQQHLSWMIRYLTFTGVVFRFEIGLLLIILLGCESLAATRSSIYNKPQWKLLPLLKKSLKEMTLTAAVSLAVTVPLDSFFWQKKWYWPEGIVFYFNVVQNKSSEWGTLPFYAYFLSFLPRCLLVAYPLAIAGFFSSTSHGLRRLLAPMIIYVALFSFLPHKEWRFIFYTLPVFTAAAANVIHQVVIRCQSVKKTDDNTANRTILIYRLLLACILGGAVISGLLAQFMFQVSRLNYPGGEALRKLHKLEQRNSNVYVHLDPDTAMTGASLYGQSNPSWQYSKNESHTTQQDILNARYTHLITAHPEQFDTTSFFDIIDVTYGLNRVSRKTFREWRAGAMERWNVWPVEYEMTPKLYTLKLKEPQQQWILATVQTYPVVMFSKSYCPYCRATKQLLSKYCNLKTQVHIIEVDHQKDGHLIKQALGRLTGRFTFPNVFKNGQSLGGFDNLSVMDQEGKLKNFCSTKQIV